MSRQIMFYGAAQKPEQHDRRDFLRAGTGRITQRSKPVSGPTACSDVLDIRADSFVFS